ncbi:MAG: response regulator [Nitrospirota bacterium]|nr:response regulator [Nitrospirota bacterium]
MNILLFDDDLRILRFLKRGLEAESHTVATATSHSQGWELLQIGEFDLVILDVFLGEENGLDFCRQLRQQQHTVPVLMMTAKDSPEMSFESQKAGANGYLPKPFAFDDLISNIDRLTRNQPPSSPSFFSGVPGMAMTVNNFCTGLLFLNWLV